MRTLGLTLYRRHIKGCLLTIPTYHPATVKEARADTCQCPIVLSGYLKHEAGRIRHLSTGTAEWAEAFAIKAELEKTGRLPDQMPGKAFDAVTVQEAVDAFLKTKSEGTGKVAPATLELYEVFTLRRLIPWCKEQNVQSVGEFDTLTIVERFDQSWCNIKSPEKALAGESRKTTMTVFRVFLNYCIDRGWLKTNVAKKIRTTRAQQRHAVKPKRYGLELNEYQRVLRYLDEFPDARLQAMIELMRWSGMRVSDAATFCESELVQTRSGWTADFIAQKNGNACTVPIPDHVAAALKALPFLSGKSWFETGEATWRFRAQHPGAKIAKCFREAQKKYGAFAHPASAHSLRHTFAIQHLNNDVPASIVAAWMGDNVATVLKHYAHAIASTRELAEDTGRASVERMRVKIEALRVNTGTVRG